MNLIDNTKSSYEGDRYEEICQALPCDSKATKLIEIKMKLLVCDSCAVTKFNDKVVTE